MGTSRRRSAALLVLACLSGGLLPVVAATPAHAAGTLSIRVLTWDVIGQDSNRTQGNGSRPFFFPVRAEICNTGDASISDVSTSWSWVTANTTKINLVSASSTTRTIGTLAAGGTHGNSAARTGGKCAIVTYNLTVPQAAKGNILGQTAQYKITASGTSVTSVDTGTRTLYVKGLVSQSRNAVVSVTAKNTSDNTNPCSGTTCTVYEGATYKFTLISRTATAYNALETFLLLPDQIFTVTDIQTSYATAVSPGTSTKTADYSDACVWSGPTTTSVGACTGGGKTGGNPIKTVYTVKVLSGASVQTCTGTACMSTLIYDNSGGSFHYNSDVAAAGNNFTIVAKAPADLKLTKSHSGAFASPGTGSYTVTVTNQGPTATGTQTMSFRDELPSGMTLGLGGATGTDWTCPSLAGSSTVTCTRSTSLASGSSSTITVPVTVATGVTTGQHANKAIVCFGTPTTVTSCPSQPASGVQDPDLRNNSVTDDTTVATALQTDLVLTKARSGNITRPGSVAYTFVIRNDGPGDTTSGPSLTDTLPTGITYSSFSGTDWSCSASGQDVSCSYASLLTNGSSTSTLTINATVGSGAADNVINSATASGGGTTDPNTNNNTSTDYSTTASADVALDITHTGNLLIPSSGSGTGTFTVSVTNNGPDAVSTNGLSGSPPLKVYVALPTGLSYGSVSGTGWTCPTVSGQIVQCQSSAGLAASASTSFSLGVTFLNTISEQMFSLSGIACAGTPTLNSTTSVYECPSSGATMVTSDPDTSNNTAEDAVYAYKVANISISKTSSNTVTGCTSPCVTAGTNLTYSITVSNPSSGSNSATNVFWEDTLPSGVTFVSVTLSINGAASSSADNCSDSGQVITCNIPSLPTGQSATSSLVVSTSSSAPKTPASVTNVVAVTADQMSTAASASLVANVQNGNTPPTATAGSVALNEDASQQVITLAGSDSEGDAMVGIVTSLPTHGDLYVGSGTSGVKLSSLDVDPSSSPALSYELPALTVTYVPTANYNGSDSFNFKVKDASGGVSSSSATESITVRPVNDAPTWDASIAMTSSSTLDLRTVSADLETGDDNLSYSIQTNGTKGTASLSGTNNRTLSYAKNSGQSGTDSVTVRVTDRGDPDNCGTVVVNVCTVAAIADRTITINLVANSGPTATAQTGGDKVSVTEDGTVLITLAGTDPDGDSLTFNVTGQPANGKLYKGNSTNVSDEITGADSTPVALTGTTVTFVPTANYNNGASASGASFTFTVTDTANATSAPATVEIDVNPVNDTPTWDASVSMGSSDTLDFRTVSADQETGDDNLSYSLVEANGGATKGTASLGGTNNRTLSYSKTDGQTGTDSVTIRVTDRGDPDNCGSVAPGSCTATATADKTVTINLSNNAPSATAQTGGSKVSVNEDASVLITLAGADADADTLSFSLESLPSNGTLYRGNSTAAGNVIASGDLPHTLASNGSTVTFKPTANYHNGSNASGPSFTFKAHDASLASAAATVDIDVNPVNDSPVAADSTITTSAGTATINLVNITTDQETTSANHIFKVASLPSAGTLKDGTTTITSGALPYTLANGTTLTYTQPTNRAAADDVSFGYSVTDRGDPDNCGVVVAGACTAALTDTGTVSVDITNAAPTATSQTVADTNNVSVAEDGSVLITLAGTDPEGDTLTFKITSVLSNGKLYKGNSTSGTDEITTATSSSPVTLTGATVTFVPTADYNNGASASGPSFTFTATDVTGSNTASSAATVEVDVNPANDAPTWSATVAMGSTATLDLRTVSADQETDDDDLSYSIVTNGSKGTASLSGTNSRTLGYTKTAGQTGSDTVVVRVTDRGDPDNCGSVAAGACTGTATADKTITINLSNAAPTAGISLFTLPNTGDPAILSSTQAPKTNDTVRASATCADGDGDNVTLTFVWKVQRVGPPVTIETLRTTTVPAGLCSGSFTDHLDLSKAGNGDKGETIIVEVTPNDGTIDGTTATGSTTVVDDTPPTATDRIVKTGVNQAKAIVLEGSDVDGEPVTFTITQQPATGTLTVANDSTKDCFTAAGTVVTRGSYTSPGTETCHLDATYTPADGFTGTATFKYKVENSDAGSRIATVTVQIEQTVETGINQTDDAEQETVQGALVSTGSEPSSDDPVETQIVAVRNGRIVIREEPVTGTPPSGFSFFGQQIQIDVYDNAVPEQPVVTTATEPMRFTFLLDPSIVPAGKTVADVEVYRDGVELSNCTGGPDLVQPLPACVLTKAVNGGAIEIRIVTTAASVWNFAVPAPTGGGGGGGGGGPVASPTPTPDITPGPSVSPTEPPARLLRPLVRIRVSDSTPKQGSHFLVKTRLARCPGHEGTMIRLGHVKGDEWIEIGRKALDDDCHAQWRLEANFKKRSYQTIWDQQDDDHRFGRSRIRAVVPHGRLPGPWVRLFVDDETPELGDVIVFRTRIERCAGLEGDRIQLWRLDPGLTKRDAEGDESLLVMPDGIYRKQGTKRVDQDCHAEFRVTVDFQEATFRTIWPKQDPRYRMGRAEPVALRVT